MVVVVVVLGCHVSWTANVLSSKFFLCVGFLGWVLLWFFFGCLLFFFSFFFFSCSFFCLLSFSRILLGIGQNVNDFLFDFLHKPARLARFFLGPRRNPFSG